MGGGVRGVNVCVLKMLCFVMVYRAARRDRPIFGNIEFTPFKSISVFFISCLEVSMFSTN